MPKQNLQFVRLHATISGRVQGVGFRFFVRENALRLNLTGWVRNRFNGAVEVVAEGPKLEAEGLLRALQRGPAAAYVSQVHYDWLDATGEYRDFKVRLTG